VVAIAVASEEELQRLAGRVGVVAMPLLADSDGAVARLYGAWDKDQGGCTPMAYVADRAHKIVWARNGDGALPPAVAELEKAFRGCVK
jgi:peroxiredoxin